ncbi:MAG: EMC3/TMCO1 family protein [Candidatus Poseidoniaceae archaeon]|nr:EMC3/TMCO1 family protein [Candidatus Poseidoniaceae archaeon]
MANGNNPPPPQPPGGSMMMMLMVMVLMTLLIMNPGIRSTMGGFADPLLSPILPEESFFIITVLILGTMSMLMNTVLRSFFLDPIEQAHIGHRQGQVRRMMNDARISRDPILQEKATLLQQQMMPEQLKVQMGAMKPMMFTMVIIIAVFSWLTTTVESFRVDYVSLPWASEWNLLTDKFLFFPAWICAYICMSAPFGRVVDRHIKLIRYRTHPVVSSGDKLKEPLLHLVANQNKTVDKNAKRRRQKSKVQTKKKSSNDTPKNTGSKKTTKTETYSGIDGLTCPKCGVDMISKAGPRKKKCDVCRHQWV